MMIVTAAYWGIGYWITGSVPATNETALWIAPIPNIQLAKQLISLSLSQPWLAIPILGLWTMLVVRYIREAIQTPIGYIRSTLTLFCGLISGLACGLICGLIFGLASGFIAGLILKIQNMNSPPIFYPATCWLGNGIAIGLISGPILGLGFGIAVGLTFEVGIGMALIIIRLSTLLHPPPIVPDN
ncbi:MAG: hypothetical protein WC553_01590 [Patescibacteria group bacterium]